jgi:hypothetical protein
VNVPRGAFVLGGLGALVAAAPAPSPSPMPTSDPQAEALFAKAKAAWTNLPAPPPFINYGALIRYLYHGHVFDNWWDGYYRTSDAAFALNRITDEEEDRRRLAGVPFSIFSYKVFDTNPLAEPIRLDPPAISPLDSFGLLVRHAGPLPKATPSPEVTIQATPLGTPLPELAVVEVIARDYRIALAGTETLQYGQTYHLTLTPLRQPAVYRLRDLWIDTTTSVTLRMRVQGLLSGKPYDGVSWTVDYVPIAGHYFVQQIKSDDPLHFGLDTVIPAMEFDFVDYRFPTNVPVGTFGGKLL